MVSNMKIFVTGHRGFIGAHLVDVLKQEGHTVVGCDLKLFDGCNWEPLIEPDRELVKDVRTIEASDLDGCDCVMHLAAISNDPMGELNAQLTFDINRDASIRLAKIAKHAGVPRFLFAGSCSIYGKGEKLDLDENDPLNPLTAYAKSKIETEQAVSKLADASFTPVYLRNATAYGHSPMLRIDLVVNNLLASAMSYGEIRIQSDGSPWRPLIHCRDIARAFAAFAKAPSGGCPRPGRERRRQQRKLSGPRCRRPGSAADPHALRSSTPARSALIRGTTESTSTSFPRLLPDFRLQYNLVSGMEELYRKMVEHGFGKKDFEGDQFVRLRTLKGRFNLLS